MPVHHHLDEALGAYRIKAHQRREGRLLKRELSIKKIKKK